MQLTVNSIQPVISLLRERRIRLDPRFLGELQTYHAVGNIRASYFRRNGLTVDGFGEMLLDRGFVATRPTEREVLDLLDRIFTSGKGEQVTGDVTEDDIARATEQELSRARTNRHRAYSCACGKSSLRSPRLDLLLTCGYCNGRVVRTERTVAEIQHDIPLSVIQSPEYRIGDAGFMADESVPF